MLARFAASGLFIYAMALSAQVNDGAKYSPLKSINRATVAGLAVAWTFHTGDIYTGSKGGLRGKQSAFETVPLFVDNTLFITTPFGRVIALEPETGKQKWAFDPVVDKQAGWGDFANRGVATWVDPEGKRRLFVATIDARLFALDALTGHPIPGFANEGHYDLKQGLRLPVKEASEYEETSAPAVIGDVIVVGSAIADNGRTDMPSGEVRAFDVRTGKLLWTFDPLAGTRTGAANAWSTITPDPENGIVFVPTGSASPDYYGGQRKGNNSYANSVVALNAKTGKVVWSFQTVHHDLWDYDVASQPALITVKGKPALAVGSKTGNLFLLDRLTGKPVFGVEERPVPKSDVPGEAASPTQPFPILPAHLGPVRAEAWGPTDEEKAWCAAEISKLRYDGIFTPPSLRGSLFFPGNIGGMAWGGVAFDRQTATLYVPYNRLAAVARLVPRADLAKARKERPDWETASQTGTPYGMQRNFLLSPKAVPLYRASLRHAGRDRRQYRTTEVGSPHRLHSLETAESGMGLSLPGRSYGDGGRPGLPGCLLRPLPEGLRFHHRQRTMARQNARLGPGDSHDVRSRQWQAVRADCGGRPRRSGQRSQRRSGRFRIP